MLEVGGGVGEIQIELLERGAARTVNLELSPGYDEVAAQLLREHGLEGRAERRLQDIAVEPESVEPADVVVLHRVVCCYPDYERLLGAVAEHARHAVVFSYPPRNVLSRCGSQARTSCFGSCAASTGRSRIRRARCSRCSSGAACGRRSPAQPRVAGRRARALQFRPARLSARRVVPTPAQVSASWRKRYPKRTRPLWSSIVRRSTRCAKPRNEDDRDRRRGARRGTGSGREATPSRTNRTRRRHWTE